MPQAHVLWQVRCFRDPTLMKKSLKAGKRRSSHCQCSLVVVRTVLSEILTRAPATLSLFCADGIALFVARCLQDLVAVFVRRVFGDHGEIL